MRGGHRDPRRGLPHLPGVSRCLPALPAVRVGDNGPGVRSEDPHQLQSAFWSGRQRLQVRNHSIPPLSLPLALPLALSPQPILPGYRVKLCHLLAAEFCILCQGAGGWKTRTLLIVWEEMRFEGISSDSGLLWREFGDQAGQMMFDDLFEEFCLPLFVETESTVGISVVEKSSDVKQDFFCRKFRFLALSLFTWQEKLQKINWQQWCLHCSWLFCGKNHPKKSLFRARPCGHLLLFSVSNESSVATFAFGDCFTSCFADRSFD